MGHTFRIRSRTLAVVLTASAAVSAATAGSRTLAADHLEAPILAQDLGFVSTEFRPLPGQTARGILHLSARPAGSRESIAFTAVKLMPGQEYEIGLTRGTCRALGDVHSFFDLGAELAFTADSNGTISILSSKMDLTRPRPRGRARTAVIRRAEDDVAVACGLLQAFRRVDVRKG